MKTLPLFRYAAIRQNNGRNHFIDIDTMSRSFTDTDKKAVDIDSLSPQWAKNCPMVAIKKVRIQVVGKGIQNGY